MINYKETKRGDILKIVGEGAPGFAGLGDLVRVTSVHFQSVWVENREGKLCEFVFNCGAARLEPTDQRNDFALSEGSGDSESESATKEE